MEAGIRITGDELGTIDDPAVTGYSEAHVHSVGLDSVHVSGPGEAEANGDEHAGARWECSLCHHRLREDGSDVDDDTEYCAEHPDDGKHEPNPIPISWLNSAGIDIDQDNDTVTVRISVGDPRGAFAMKIERLQYTDSDGNDRDELRLNVPTDQDGMPHMQLTPLASPGYYRIA